MTRKELLKSRIKVGSKVIVKLPAWVRSDGSTYENEGMATVTKIDEQFWHCEFDHPLVDPVVNSRNKKAGISTGVIFSLSSIEQQLQTGMIHPADLKYRVGDIVAYSIINNVIECTGKIWTIDVNPKNKPYRFISCGILYSANEKYLIKHDAK